MRKCFIIILMSFQTFFAVSQNNSGSLTELIKKDAEENFNKWLEKSEFEKDSQYQERISHAADTLRKFMVNKFIETKTEKLKESSTGKLIKYDAEYEKYYIKADKDTIIINVSPDIAKELTIKCPKQIDYMSQAFGGARGIITIIPQEVILKDNNWSVSDAIIIFNLENLQFKKYSYDSKKGLAIYVYGSDYTPTKINVADIRTVNNNSSLSGYIYYYKWNISEQINKDSSSLQANQINLSNTLLLEIEKEIYRDYGIISKLSEKVYCSSDGISSTCNYIPRETDLFQTLLFLNDSVFVKIVNTCCGASNLGEEFAWGYYYKGIYKLDDNFLTLNFKPQRAVYYEKEILNTAGDTSIISRVALEKSDLTLSKLERFNCKDIPYFEQLDGFFKGEYISPTEGSLENYKKYIEELGIWEKLFPDN